MSSFTEKIIADNTVILDLMKAKLEDGRPFFAYVVLRQTEFDELNKKKEGLMSLPENSIVLYSDYGHDVPPHIEHQVLHDYHMLFKNSA